MEVSLQKVAGLSVVSKSCALNKNSGKNSGKIGAKFNLILQQLQQFTLQRDAPMTNLR